MKGSFLKVHRHKKKWKSKKIIKNAYHSCKSITIQRRNYRHMMMMMIKMRMRHENLQNHNFDEIKKLKKVLAHFLMRFFFKFK